MTTIYDLDFEASNHEAVFGERSVPDHIREALVRYVDYGLPSGDMLRAVLANDLQGAFARADWRTAQCMAAIVAYVYNKVPSFACGSYEAVDGWIALCLENRRNLAKAESADESETAAEAP